MIRPCTDKEFSTIFEIINNAAIAYKDIIPDDCFHEPYMSSDELKKELSDGVNFWGWEDAGELVGVMGIQRVKDVHLIRHAYVRNDQQGKGIGGSLLQFLRKEASGKLLVGTWAAAFWAIGLYQKHGYLLTDQTTKDTLLDTYWKISPRQKETSVVLIHSLY